MVHRPATVFEEKIQGYSTNRIRWGTIRTNS